MKSLHNQLYIYKPYIMEIDIHEVFTYFRITTSDGRSYITDFTIVSGECHNVQMNLFTNQYTNMIDLFLILFF